MVAGFFGYVNPYRLIVVATITGLVDVDAPVRLRGTVEHLRGSLPAQSTVLWHADGDDGCLDAAVETTRVPAFRFVGRDSRDRLCSCVNIVEALGVTLGGDDLDVWMWVSVADAVLSGDPVRDSAAALLGVLYQHPDGASARPLLAECAARARAEVLTRLVAEPSLLRNEELLRRYLGALADAREPSAYENDVDGDPSLIDRLVELGGPEFTSALDTWGRDPETSGPGPSATPAEVDLAWRAATGVRVWRVPAPDRTSTSMNIEAYDPGTGVVLGSLLCDVRVSHDRELFCLDDGYTSAEVVAAWKTLGSPEELLEHDRGAADYIAALRYATTSDR